MPNKKLPEDEILIKLLEKHNGSISKVLRELNFKAYTNSYLVRLKKKLGYKMGLETTKKPVEIIENNVLKMKKNEIKDDYKIGDKFEYNSRIYTIIQIKKDIKNMYLCEDEYGFKGCFDFSHIKVLI